MTQVYTAPPPDGAVGQTHVLIIGVGSYPYLLGGTEPKPAVASGMEQLDSPALSAAKIADWFITTFNNPQRPLGTIEMLLSNDDGQDYTRPDSGEVFDVELANTDNIVTAGLAWKERGDTNPQDMLVFFFSGHGIASGNRMALLARDYGLRDRRPLRNAISFLDMIEGMRCCKAGLQIYFIDACRVANDTIIQQTTETGDVIVPTSVPLNKDWKGSIYYASSGGRPAFGVDGDISLFTKSLLKSLSGPGASDSEGPDDWRITTVKLSEALGHFAGTTADPVFGPVQTPQTGSQTLFDFHHMTTPPLVPIYVEPVGHEGPDPPAHAQSISVSFDGGPVVEWAPPWHTCDHCNWAPSRFESWVRPGRNYTVRLQLNEGVPVAEMSRHVSPPYTMFRMELPDA